MMQMAHLYYHLVLLHALVDHLRNHPIPSRVGNTNLHDMSPYEFLQAHVYEIETVVVLDDDITDGLNHDDDDLYDPSYKMDLFNIITSVDSIETHVSKSIPRPVMNETACENQDKWFNINYKAKDLRDQIDDKYKSVKLSYNKSPSSSPFPSTPPSKPPFHPKQSHDINLHEITAYELLQVHTHELEPDPAPDEAFIEEPSILNHDLLEDKKWGVVPELEYPELSIFPTSKMAISLTTSLINVSLMGKPLNLFKR
jgi:hypothetical protein